jgi:hypothetical protein
LDEENAIFLLHGEKYFGFVRGNGGFFRGAGFSASGFCRAGKRIVSRRGAETRKKKGDDEIFSVKKLCFSDSLREMDGG